MEELTGLPADDVLGLRAEDVLPQFIEQQVGDMIARALRGEAVSSPDITFDVEATRRSGWISISYRPHLDSKGNIAGVIGIVRDITARKAAEQQIEFQAYHDALTGLANRRLFQEHLSLALALAQRRMRLVAVLFLDLDHFKVINDSLGHSVGDALLQQVAARLKAAVREGDTVARVGGDEFTIVLQELAKREDAALVARKVLEAISAPIDVNGHRLYVTTSIGITFFPDDGDDGEALLRNADTAMYRAKSEGRNTYQMATQELNRQTQERMTLESGMHLALERGEFELYYQPQYDIVESKIVGMEALLRWHHPERGLMFPGEFIAIAEERGLILQIGDWALRSACEQGQRFACNGRSPRLAVNLSARQFRETTLVETVRSRIQDSLRVVSRSKSRRVWPWRTSS